MKILFVCIASASLLIGCGQGSDKPPAPGGKSSSGGNPLDAPADYVRSLGKAQQSAVKTVDTTSINQAIQLFNVEKGRNPRDLNELVEQKFMPQIPAAPIGMKLVYDAQAGKVTVVKE